MGQLGDRRREISSSLVLIILSLVVPNAVLLYLFSAVDGMQGLKLYSSVSAGQMSLAGDGVLFIAFLLGALLYPSGGSSAAEAFRGLLQSWACMVVQDR